MRIEKRKTGSGQPRPLMIGGWVLLQLLFLSLAACRVEAAQAGQEQNLNAEENREEPGLIGDFASMLNNCLQELPYSGITDDGYFLKNIVKEIAKADDMDEAEGENAENADGEAPEGGETAMDAGSAGETGIAGTEKAVSSNAEEADGSDEKTADSSDAAEREAAAALWQELLTGNKEIIVGELEQQLSGWRYEYHCRFRDENNRVWWSAEESPYEVIYEALCEVYDVETEAASSDGNNLKSEQDVDMETESETDPAPVEPTTFDQPDQKKVDSKKEEKKEMGWLFIILSAAALVLLAVSMFMILLVEKIIRSLQKLDEEVKANTESFMKHVKKIEDTLCAPEYDSRSLPFGKEKDWEMPLQDKQKQPTAAAAESCSSEETFDEEKADLDMKKAEPAGEKSAYGREKPGSVVMESLQKKREELFPVQPAEGTIAFKTKDKPTDKPIDKDIRFYLIKGAEGDMLQMEIKPNKFTMMNLSDYKVIKELFDLKNDWGKVEWDSKNKSKVKIIEQKGVPLEWDERYKNYKPGGKGFLYVELKGATEYRSR